MSSFTVMVQVRTTECYKCGVTFGMCAEMFKQRLRDHKSFWCPAGHEQGFIGKTEEEKLRDQVDRLTDRVRHANGRTDAERRSHNSTRGHLTRQKKRAAAGVCPCCKRTFRQLARHMKTKHPEYPKGKS